MRGKRTIPSTVLLAMASTGPRRSAHGHGQVVARGTPAQVAKAKGSVWFATHEQVARYAKEHAA